MYEYIKGILANKYFNKKGYYAVLDVNGVGYLVEVMKKDFDNLDEICKETMLYTVLLHREDSMSLCGFLDVEVRNVFNILTQVSGVGFRMALNILNQFDLKSLISYVVQEKEKDLMKAKGVGLKLAQKIIIELRDKFINVELECIENETDEMFDEVESMLLSLGYTDEEISNAGDEINKMGIEVKTSEDLLREILKILS